ncbi:MAG: hypothetical protein IPG64_14040 [Haliea sp.]|nr:hypothetical protein [Haliea sp.]
MEYGPLDRVAADDFKPRHGRVRGAQVKLHTPRRGEQHAEATHIHVVGHREVSGVLIADRDTAVTAAAIALLVDKSSKASPRWSVALYCSPKPWNEPASSPHRERNRVSGGA